MAICLIKCAIQCWTNDASVPLQKNEWMIRKTYYWQFPRECVEHCEGMKQENWRTWPDYTENCNQNGITISMKDCKIRAKQGQWASIKTDWLRNALQEVSEIFRWEQKHKALQSLSQAIQRKDSKRNWMRNQADHKHAIEMHKQSASTYTEKACKESDNKDSSDLHEKGKGNYNKNPNRKFAGTARKARSMVHFPC